MLQVGKSRIFKIMKTGKQIRSYMTYSDVKTDYDGWADAEQYLPKEFDLVHLKLNNGKHSKGWRSTTSWDGRKFDPGTVILSWKKMDDLELN